MPESLESQHLSFFCQFSCSVFSAATFKVESKRSEEKKKIFTKRTTKYIRHWFYKQRAYLIKKNTLGHRRVGPSRPKNKLEKEGLIHFCKMDKYMLIDEWIIIKHVFMNLHHSIHFIFIDQIILPNIDLFVIQSEKNSRVNF